VEHYNREDNRIYAHYAAIVQSSGMGKSRMVDELGKTHFVIPINLRAQHSTGTVYPLFMLMPITEVLDYFQGFLLLIIKYGTF